MRGCTAEECRQKNARSVHSLNRRVPGRDYFPESVFSRRSPEECDAGSEKGIVQPAPRGPVIAVEHLTYTYPHAPRPAVSDVSFTVEPGEVFGLLGPSGAGKSTTQRVLTRLNRRFSGRVTVLSRPLADWDYSFYERIGVGFEQPNHYLRLTGRENLEFFASLYPGPTRTPGELLEQVGLKEAADVRVAEYSKGMKMRLNFVRALLHDPMVLFFDEPTAGLDPVNASVLKDLIRAEQRAGRTILLTTHNMADVEELCERAGFLVAGELRVVDSTRALKAKYGQRLVRVEYSTEGGGVSAAEFALDGLGRDPAFQRLLEDETIVSIHSQEAGLNRVFAEVTGVHLTDA
jgi:fluoroquinolone transport system ATP-binding protein